MFTQNWWQINQPLKPINNWNDKKNGSCLFTCYVGISEKHYSSAALWFLHPQPGLEVDPQNNWCHQSPDLYFHPTLLLLSNHVGLICYNVVPSGPYYTNPCDVIPKRHRERRATHRLTTNRDALTFPASFVCCSPLPECHSRTKKTKTEAAYRFHCWITSSTASLQLIPPLTQTMQCICVLPEWVEMCLFFSPNHLFIVVKQQQEVRFTAYTHVHKKKAEVRCQVSVWAAKHEECCLTLFRFFSWCRFYMFAGADSHLTLSW